MPELLIELFSEEIPARMQARAAEDLQKLVTNGLVDAGLTYAGARALATPRRLTLVVSDMLAASAPVREERKGPRADAPEKAIEGFLRSTGLTRDQLEARETKKGDVLFAVIERPGRPAAEIVAEVLENAIRTFPWPKSMRWGAGSLRWVRPLHRILCLIRDEDGAQIVPLDVDGIRAGDETEGHRFLSKGTIRVTGFDDYEAKLKRAHVVLDPQARADHIRADAENAAFAQGLELVEDPALLREVAGLVEWPVVLMGEIGSEFLSLPPEVLQTSMREHQKFFSVRDLKSGKIVRFVTVANTETSDQGATILAGNRKVLAARLSDAKFFWENDLRIAKAGMGPWKDSLANVTFHRKLGSQAARIDRIAALACEIAGQTGADADAAALAATGDDTIRSRVMDIARKLDWPARYTARVLQNAFTARWHDDIDGLLAVAEDESARWGAAFAAGDTRTANTFVGEATGLIGAIEPAAHILQDMAAQAEALLRRGADLRRAPGKE